MWLEVILTEEDVLELLLSTSKLSSFRIPCFEASFESSSIAKTTKKSSEIQISFSSQLLLHLPFPLGPIHSASNHGISISPS
jgi:hypothetical protein